MKFCHVSDLKTLLAALVYHFAGALPRAHKKTINRRISMKKQAKVPFQVPFSDFWVLSHQDSKMHAFDMDIQGR